MMENQGGDAQGADHSMRVVAQALQGRQEADTRSIVLNSIQPSLEAWYSKTGHRFKMEDTYDVFEQKFHQFADILNLNPYVNVNEEGKLEGLEGAGLSPQLVSEASILAARLVISNGTMGSLRDHLANTTQKLTLHQVLRHIQIRSEGECPTFSMMENMGQQFVGIELNTTQQVVQWGSQVQDSGRWLAQGMARLLTQHRTDILVALKNEYAREASPPVLLTFEQKVQEEVDKWMGVDERRKLYPRTPVELSKMILAISQAPQEEKQNGDKPPEPRTAAELAAQYAEYAEMHKAIESKIREAEKRGEEIPLGPALDSQSLGIDVSVAESQSRDVITHFAGLRLYEWLEMENEAELEPKEPARLSPKGWKNFFRACTPAPFKYLYGRYSTANAPRAWVEVVRSKVSLNVLYRQRAPGKQKPKHGSRGGKQASHPLQAGAQKVKSASKPQGPKGSKGKGNPQPRKHDPDPILGVPRHYLVGVDTFQALRRLEGKDQRLQRVQVLLDDLSTAKMTEHARERYRKRYEAKRRELEAEQRNKSGGVGTGKPRPPRSGVGRGRGRQPPRQNPPRRGGQTGFGRGYYSPQNQQRVHEGANVVQERAEEGNSPDPPRPDSPYPRHEYDDHDPPQDDDAYHDAYHDAPYEHNYADEREYTDDDYDRE